MLILLLDYTVFQFQNVEDSYSFFMHHLFSNHHVKYVHTFYTSLAMKDLSYIIRNFRNFLLGASRIIYIRTVSLRGTQRRVRSKIFGSVGLFAPLCDAFFGGLEDFS